jgi:hypothetical protein
MWGGRHCREGKGSKVEMVWTRNKKRLRRAGQRHYGMKGQKNLWGRRQCREGEGTIKFI